MDVLVVLVRTEVVQELVESTELMEGAVEKLNEYACTQHGISRATFTCMYNINNSRAFGKFCFEITLL